MSKDYMKAFAKIIDSMYEMYNGYRIRLDGEKFHVFDKSYDTIEEAKSEIDRAPAIISNSIKK